MKCKKFRDIITTDYIDNELGAKERAAIDAHLAVCEECRALKGSLAAVVEPIRAVDEVSPPPFLWTRIRNVLEREVVPGDYIGLKDVFSIFNTKWLSAAAMAAMLTFTLFSGIYLTNEVLNKQLVKSVEIADTLELSAFSDIPGEQAKAAYSNSNIIGG